MSRPAPGSAEARIDLAAGFVAQALKLLSIAEAQPVAALAAIHLAREILERVVEERRGSR